MSWTSVLNDAVSDVVCDTGYVLVFSDILSVSVVVSSNVVAGTGFDASDVSALSALLSTLSASYCCSPRSILNPSIAIAITITSNEMIEATRPTVNIVSSMSLARQMQYNAIDRHEETAQAMMGAFRRENTARGA